MAISRNRQLASLITNSEGTVSGDKLTGVGVDVFSTLDSLPMSSLSEGTQAFVEENSRLYVSNGSGWYNSSFVNQSPTWYTEPDASYEIADSATPLQITAKATDSDNPDLSLLNQSSGTDSAQYMVSVTNDSSVFTFTPKSADSIGIEVAAGNLTDSNGDFVYTFKWSDGINFVAKEVTITYNASGGGATGIYGSRGILFNASSGSGSNNSDTIEYFDISGSTGITTTDFGNLVEASADTPGSAVTNGIRGVYQVYHGGSNPERQLQFVTISTPGNASTFGQHIRNVSGYASWHNGTYGYFARNSNSTSTNDLAVITVATEGNAQATGYTLKTNALQYNANGAGDTTRMIIAGGEDAGGNDNGIQYVTMPVASNAVAFGILIIARRQMGSTADDTRSIFGGGYTSSSNATIDYITTQTISDATSFGTLTQQRNGVGACTDGSRGCFVGGYRSQQSSRVNTIDYVTIQTTGNASDFGDMTDAGNHPKGCSGAAA
jgi:hypothetical protein|tara:strand:- start:237 stop:1715 length:1479 start_codon:yes stop_codon:yes gene_type:complete